MIQFKPVQATSIAASVLFVFLCSCGSQISGINAEAPGAQTAPVIQQDNAGGGFPAALPEDSLQPWEELNSAGFIQNASSKDQRQASGINTTSEFYYGAQEWDRSASALDSGDIMQLDATAGLSWVLYRMPLGGDEPGVVSLDVNLKPADGGGQSEYWVGLADYGKNTWDWSGPFTNGRVRLGTVASGSDFTSPLGSLFVTVAAYDGSKVDVIGVGASVVDPLDTTAPPQVAGLTLNPVAGGLELTWNNVIAGDLAGYLVVFADAAFADQESPGVDTLPYHHGNTICILPAAGETFVRVAAVDIAGNTGPVSDLASAEPLAGSLPELQVDLDQASVLVNDAVTATASGAESYDWDLDGDGVFDLTDAPSPQAVDTSGAGIIRPLVRGSSGGTAVAHGAVSLIVAGNSRPVVQATADITSGPAPLTVNFSSIQADFDGTIAERVWNFLGTSHVSWRLTTAGGAENPPPYNYTGPGLYNSRVKVWDDDGAWDVDSIAVLVNPGPPAPNQLPSINVSKSTTSGDAPLTVVFDCTLSSDPDGTIVEYAWDWDGNGAYDEFSEGPVVSHTFTTPGSPLVRVRVEDNDGGRKFTQFTITVNAPGNDLPVADLAADRTVGYAPFTIVFDASASSDSDGSIVNYEWDFDGDGAFEAAGPSPTATHSYLLRGWYLANVRVTDDAGAQDYATIDITLPSEWTPYNRFGSNSGRSPFIGPQTNNSPWAFPTAGGGLFSTPSIGVDGTIYIGGGGSSKLFAVNPDGTEKWSYTAGGSIQSSPVVGDDGTIYVGSYDSSLYAVNPDGTLKWATPLSSQIISTPAIGPDGMIYICTYTGGDVYCLYPDGSIRWTYLLGENLFSSPAIGPDGTVYVGSGSSGIHAITAEGEQKWNDASLGSIRSSAAVGPDGTIYIGSDDDNLYAFNPDGTQQWAFLTTGSVFATPAFTADGKIITASQGGVNTFVYAVNPDGTESWSFPVSGTVSSTPAIGADGVIYFSSFDNFVYALNPDGTELWSYDTGGLNESSPAISRDGYMYIGATAGNMLAFGP